jgi:hypothetical protein
VERRLAHDGDDDAASVDVRLSIACGRRAAFHTDKREWRL